MPQAQDDFEPDDFEVDDFEEDTFEELKGVSFDSPTNKGFGELKGVSYYPKPAKTPEAVRLTPPKEQGRKDERFIDTDKFPRVIDALVDRIAMSNLPEGLRNQIAYNTSFYGNFGLGLLEAFNDPTALAGGFLGAGKKAALKGHAKAEADLAADLLSETRLLDEEQAAERAAIAARTTIPGVELQPQKAGTPIYNTSQFGLQPLSEERVPPSLATVPNRLRPPSTNATVFDALLPEQLKYNEQGAAQRLSTDVQPPIVQPERIKSDITFNGKTLDEINALESGRLDESMTGMDVPDPRLQEIPIGTHGSALPIAEERLPQTGMFGQPVVSNIMGEAPKPNAIEDWWNWAREKTNRPMRTGNVDVTTLDNPIAKIIVKLRQARPLNKQQQELYRIERGKRAGEVDKAGGTGKDWIRNVGSALKGEYEKVRFDPLDLSEPEFNVLIDNIKASDLDTFSKARAGFAIEKIMRGVVPQRNEIKTLSSIFTKQLTRDLGDPATAQDITAQLVAELYKKKPMYQRLGGGAQDLQRTMMSSMDMSAPFRQGITGIYNKEWWTSWDDMFKAWGSEKASLAIDDSIRSMPDFPLMEKSKLSLTDTNTPGGPREEGFGSGFAEKYVPFIKRSERAYAAFLNKFRADLFARMMVDARKSGHPEELMARYVADHINTITGRASLGKGEKYVEALNQVFYAPKLMASRVKMLDMLNPVFYIKQPTVIRKQALKSVLSMATVTGAANIIGAMAGGALESDPRSSDFGKVKFGNTRIDPGGGEIQYLTALARMLSQSTKTQAGEVQEFGGGFKDASTYEILRRFLENKAAPGMSLILKGAKGYDPGGMEYNMPVEVAKTYTPMILGDLANIFQEDPETFMPEMPSDPRAIAAAPLTFFGFGSQTYK